MIVANPARVLALVEILRDQLVRMHELRVSNEERGSKTDELYAFITSEHCKQLIEQVEAQAGKMLDLDTKEQEAHRRLWDQRAKLIHSVQKARGDLVLRDRPHHRHRRQRPGRCAVDHGCALGQGSRPSAFSAACTAGRWATRSRYATTLG